MDPADMRQLLDSWLLDMSASRRSANTRKQYSESVLIYLDWCSRQGENPDLSRDQVRRFQVALTELGRSPSTVLARQAGCKRFSRWLAAEGEIDKDELAGLAQPQLEEAVPVVLTDDQVRSLLATCDRSFYGRRDESLIRFLVETMVRASECLSLESADISLRDGIAVIRHSKTRKARVVAFGPATARSLDRYSRMRRSQKGAELPQLWLGTRGGKPMSYGALYASLRRRALRADPPFRMHPHIARSTGAVRFRTAGGSVSSLMSLAGWASLEQAAHYVRAAESDIAVREARALDLGLSFD